VTGSSNAAYGDAAGNGVSGGFNTAIGASSGNSVTGLNNIALGHFAGRNIAASDTVAIGTRATASGTGGIAVGANAFAAGPGDTAIGEGATVQADNSSAFGAGATVLASHTNSTAIGAGATTTRANQVMVGTASTTYTMPGLTSSASRSAQGSPTNIVTSNAAGDLAAYTPSELGLATQTQVASLQSDVAGLQSDVAGLQADINRLGRRDQQLTEGIATVASMAQPILDPGQTFGMTAAWGGFDDANAVGVSAAGVLGRNLLHPGSGTLALFGGVGVGTSEGQIAGRAGMSFGW
jgi:autotransporter adhesin